MVYVLQKKNNNNKGTKRNKKQVKLAKGDYKNSKMVMKNNKTLETQYFGKRYLHHGQQRRQKWINTDKNLFKFYSMGKGKEKIVEMFYSANKRDTNLKSKKKIESVTFKITEEIGSSS